MDRLMQFLTNVDRQAPSFSTEALVLALLLSFVLGQVIAFTYNRTHTGLSYSRSFTQSLVLMMMVVSLVMFVIGNNIITAFGLIGALALIRFRNVLKDTRDTVFVFIALVMGMAAGSQRFTTAILGTAALSLLAFYLHFTRFGSKGHYHGHLTCRVTGPAHESDALLSTLRRFCRNAHRISARHDAETAEFIFQVRLRDRERGGEMTEELKRIEGMSDVALVLRDELAEV